MIFICIHFFELLDFKCYEDHECSYTYAAMVGRVMLCGVGSVLGPCFWWILHLSSCL